MFFILTLASALAEEPQKELMISSETIEASGYTDLGADALSSAQLSFAYRIMPEISAVASWSMGRIDTSYSISEGSTDRWSFFESRLDRQQLMLGGRYAKPLASWLRAYGQIGATVAYNGLLFQDNIESDDPLTKQSSSAVNFGGIVGVGFLGSLQIKEDLPLLLFSFELGYSLQSEAQLSENIGALDLSGRYSRFGIGIAF